MFEKRISKIEEMGQEFFEDGLYISGKLLRRFKAKKKPPVKIFPVKPAAK